MGKEGPGGPDKAEGRKPASSLPNMKDFRDTAISEAERRYLAELKAITGGNIRSVPNIWFYAPASTPS